jgi:hypothetical protein
MAMIADGPKSIRRIFEEGTLIDKALKAAARQALLLHKRAGLPIAVYARGKTVWIPADKIRVGSRPKRRKAKPRA